MRRAGPLDSTREVQELGEKEARPLFGREADLEDDEPLLIEDIDPPKFPSEPEKARAA